MRYMRLEKAKTKHVQMKLLQQYLLDKISGMIGSLILIFRLYTFKGITEVSENAKIQN